MSPELLRQLPPTLLQVGDAEILLSDATELAARAVEAGAVEMELVVYPQMWHCWPFYSMLPTRNGVCEPLAEAMFALDDLADFLRRKAPRRPTPASPLALAQSSSEVSTDLECDVCCVCLEKPSPSALAEVGMIRLWCEHAICITCGAKASEFSHRHCPICRTPHTLDVNELRGRVSAFRSSYQSWRRGCSRGARAEVSDIVGFSGWRLMDELTPPAPKEYCSKLAGVLFVPDGSSLSLSPSSVEPMKCIANAATCREDTTGPAATPRAVASHPAPPTAGRLYAYCLHPRAPPHGWFSRDDRRFHLVAANFYSLLFTHPLEMLKFHKTWSTLYFSWWLAPLATLALPLVPLCTYLNVLASETGRWLLGDCFNEAADSPFFHAPADFVSRVNAKCQIDLILRVGSFLQFGSDAEALQHTKKDEICTKEFWLDLLDLVGAPRPRQLALWSNGQVNDVGPGVGAGNCDLVVKIVDSYMGRGDRVFKRGVDFAASGGTAQLTAALVSDPAYTGQTCAMLCELARPVAREKVCLSSEGFNNVHSLDILTVRDSCGAVKVLSCLLWTDCSSWTSHSCTAGYTIDVESETIVAGAPWYSSAFSKNEESSPALSLVGVMVPGVRAACNYAVAAHAAASLPWLTSVGWDAMITDDGPIFFEGNLGSMRTPRRIFLDDTSLELWMSEMGFKPRFPQTRSPHGPPESSPRQLVRGSGAVTCGPADGVAIDGGATDGGDANGIAADDSVVHRASSMPSWKFYMLLTATQLHTATARYLLIVALIDARRSCSIYMLMASLGSTHSASALAALLAMPAIGCAQNIWPLRRLLSLSLSFHIVAYGVFNSVSGMAPWAEILRSISYQLLIAAQSRSLREEIEHAEPVMAAAQIATVMGSVQAWADAAAAVATFAMLSGLAYLPPALLPGGALICTMTVACGSLLLVAQEDWGAPKAVQRASMATVVQTMNGEGKPSLLAVLNQLASVARQPAVMAACVGSACLSIFWMGLYYSLPDSSSSLVPCPTATPTLANGCGGDVATRLRFSAWTHLAFLPGSFMSLWLSRQSPAAFTTLWFWLLLGACFSTAWLSTAASLPALVAVPCVMAYYLAKYLSTLSKSLVCARLDRIHALHGALCMAYGA